MDTIISLKQTWDSLLKLENKQNGWESLLWERFGDFVVYAGIKSPELKEALLIGYPLTVALADGNLPRGKGFSVQKIENGPGPDKHWLALCREGKADLSIFMNMSMDVQNVLKKNRTPPAKTLKRFLDRIILWQNFMKPAVNGKMSIAAQRGLIGELWFLQELLEADVDEDLILSAWTGPLGTSKDFKFGTTFIEVKTSSVPKSNQIQISSLDQLDQCGTEALYLVNYFICDDDRGQTLLEVVKETREKLSAANLLLFNNLLSLVTGSGPLNQYGTKFLRTDQKSFAVVENFPAIVRSKMPAEIIDATYDLNIANLSQYVVPMKQIVAALGIKENELE